MKEHAIKDNMLANAMLATKANELYQVTLHAQNVLTSYVAGGAKEKETLTRLIHLLMDARLVRSLMEVPGYNHEASSEVREVIIPAIRAKQRRCSFLIN